MNLEPNSLQGGTCPYPQPSEFALRFVPLKGQRVQKACRLLAIAMAATKGVIRITEPTKEGWLEKQSRHLKRWKRRWFVLDGHMLYSFKERQKYTDPTETIDLRVFSSVKSSEDYTNRPNSFDVYSSEMCFSMVAKKPEEKEDWIRAIGKAIVISRTSTWQEEFNESEESEDE